MRNGDALLMVRERGRRRAPAPTVFPSPGAASRAAQGGGGARREEGYSLAMLVIMITVMGTLVAAALPTWTKVIQRDNEEELISRGWQYAEAIRVFQRRFGRLPVTLDELIKAKPRCLRHRYKDPMTGGDFEPIFVNQPLTPKTPGPDGKDQPSKKAGGTAGDSGTDEFGKPKVVPAGPIRGVRSPSNKESSLLFFGQNHYDQWQFTVELLSGGPIAAPGGGAAVPGRGGGLARSTRWLGRPLPFGAPPQPTGPGGPSKPPPPRPSSKSGRP
jgi:type II secretory pathway pseudopilin PulG